jgi:branched-subunit amino acid ABC-type transport system permease component
MGVINMAHGEFIMMGAYTGYVVQQFVEHKSFRFKLSSSMGIHGHPWAFRVQFGIEGFVEWCATGSSALEIVLLQEDPEQEFVG